MSTTTARVNAASSERLRHYFPRNPRGTYLVVSRGDGVYLYDENGRRFLDGASGAAVACLGHAHPRIVAAIAAQASRVAFAHTSVWLSEPLLELTARIARYAPDPSSRVYLVSGGSEAVETAIKIARTYQLAVGKPDKYRILARNISYHGATLGALAATGLRVRRAPYEPLLAAFPRTSTCYCYRCPIGKEPNGCAIECAGDVERALVAHGCENIAAFIFEPVIGASAPGVAPPAEYMRTVADACARHDVLLIADEVMAGVGRTGCFFAVDHYGVRPDLIVLSKALSGGYAPLGAVVVSGRVYEMITRAGSGHFTHGLTYSGNPLSAAVGLEVLKVIEEDDLIARVASMGLLLLTRLGALRNLPMVGDVRGKGLLIGVEFVVSRESREPFPAEAAVSRRVFEACLDEELVVYPGSGSVDGLQGDHILLAPPYIVTEQEVEELVRHLVRALHRVQKNLQVG